MINIKLPEIGEGINKVTITDILVKNNQTISKNDVLIIVESEKASMEIPSESDGIISSIKVENGDELQPGDTILSLNPKESEKEIAIKNSKQIIIGTDEEESDSKNKKEKLNKNINEDTTINNHASPSIRKLARELDCDLKTVNGSGRKGRITKEDLYKNLTKTEINIETKENKTEFENTIFNELSKWGKTEQKNINNIKKVTAKRLHKAWSEIPHVTQFEEIDITKLDQIKNEIKKLNKEPKIKISFLPFFIKAIAKILKEIPEFNTSLSDNRKSLIYRNYYNIGIATDTPRGLVVPVIKNVDKKSLKQIAHELTKIIYKAKEKRLSLEDMSGGCITISSLGSIGGNFFTPIINPPEVAILGISKFEIKPKLINKVFRARKILPISLSYDHRVIDGAQAVRFTKLFSKLISNPNLLVDEQ